MRRTRRSGARSPLDAVGLRWHCAAKREAFAPGPYPTAGTAPSHKSGSRGSNRGAIGPDSRGQQARLDRRLERGALRCRKPPDATSRTREPQGLRAPWVRIPSSPPERWTAGRCLRNPRHPGSSTARASSRTGRRASSASAVPRHGAPGAVRLSPDPRDVPTVSGWREALTRSSHLGRRDRVEPPVRPPRGGRVPAGDPR